MLRRLIFSLVYLNLEPDQIALKVTGLEPPLSVHGAMQIAAISCRINLHA